MSPTEGGTILEAETARFVGLQQATASEGYTGTGYLDVPIAPNKHSVEWTFEAPEAGTYILELRYALTRQGQYPCQVAINGHQRGNILCWTTGGPATWAWDRKPVMLRKGQNTITLAPNGPLLIDHLNVLYGELESNEAN
jgi:hypothetical protein